MMRRFYALIPVLVALIIPTVAWADVWQDPVSKVNYEYTPGKNEASVKAGTWSEAGSPDASGDIMILSSFTINGETHTVTSIAKWAFKRCTIKNVSIPNTVKEIGDGAWADCWNLLGIWIEDLTTWCSIKFESGYANGFWVAKHFYVNSKVVNELIIPDGVTSIESRAFTFLNSINSVTIPSTVTNIGYAFFGCNGLKKVVSYIEEPFAINAMTFYKSDIYASEIASPDATLYVPTGTKAKYEATDGWKEFKNIVEMTPYNVLDDNTVAAHFLELDENGKVEIPEKVEIDGKTYTVTEIAADAFKDNKELTEVTIPSTVTTIGEGAFAGCENLRAIYVFAPDPISLTAAEARSLMTRAAENVPSQLEGIDFDACILYVPIGSEQKYREAEGWKLFTHIVGVEDPSGIATVYTEKNDYGAVYNLSGQRLAAPQKGLNIVDGRKVVMK